MPGATQNADGTWTVITTNLESLTVTTVAGFVGAFVLTGTMNWANANGMEFSSFSDNVEAYAPGSPIFAVSGADTLTGAGGNDLFVFAQPIGNDVIYNFNVASDKIDIVNFSGISSFSNIQLANDTNGNAVITLGTGETITLMGVAAASLTANNANNFVFDQTPVTNNTGTMTIGDGALLPLSGTINNSGTIALSSSGDLTELQLTGDGITLTGGGNLVMSDSETNLIVGTSSAATLTNANNVISGAGQIGSGDGSLTLINDGTIDANYAGGILTLSTGHIITNAGVLEATNGGTLLIKDGVSGGTATIAGSTLTFDAQSNVNVTFNNGTGTPTYGELVLADAPAFTGQIFGFTGTAPGLATSDAIDLTDINFTTLTTKSYSGNSAGGTLVVSDGTNTTTLYFSGNYTLASFYFANDGQGGTLITDPPLGGTTATTITSTSTDSPLTTTSTDSSSNLVPDVDQTAKHPTIDPLPSQTLQNAADSVLPQLADLSTLGALPKQAWDNAADSRERGWDNTAGSRLSARDALSDLSDIAFGANTTLGYGPNDPGIGGAAGVNDGKHTASIALFSQYAAAGFQFANNNNGALVTNPLSLSSENEMLITIPTHKP
jgi:hypothetical protein